MARTPQISGAIYTSLVERTADIGHDTSERRLVPQKWELPATAGERGGLAASGTCGSTIKDLSATCP